MTKIKVNPLFAQMSGKMGKLVFKTSKNGEITISKLPEKSKALPSEAQLARRQSFAKASEYVASVQADETARLFYKDLARRRKTTVRALCMGDYLNPPTIPVLDASDYKGRVGDPIFIQACDDVGVVAVHVRLTRADGTPIENGKGVELGAGARHWQYRATVAVPLGTEIFISADALDRPGHRAVASINPIVGESD